MQFPSSSVQSRIIQGMTDRQNGHMGKPPEAQHNQSGGLQCLKEATISKTFFNPTAQYSSLYGQQFCIWPNVKYEHHLYVWCWIMDRKVFLQNVWMSQTIGYKMPWHHHFTLYDLWGHSDIDHRVPIRSGHFRQIWVKSLKYHIHKNGMAQRRRCKWMYSRSERIYLNLGFSFVTMPTSSSLALKSMLRTEDRHDIASWKE